MTEPITVKGLITNFEKYVREYMKKHEASSSMDLPGLETTIVIPDRVAKWIPTAKWQVAICRSPDNQFKGIAFLNGVSTPNDDKYVGAVMRTILSELHKNGLVSPCIDYAKVAKLFWIFVNRKKHQNPDDNAETHYTPDKWTKLNLIALFPLWNIFELDFSQHKALKHFKDATCAGTQYSRECTLWVFEGKSGLNHLEEVLLGYLGERGKARNGFLPLQGNLKKPDSKASWAKDPFLRAIMIALGLTHPANGRRGGERYGKIIMCFDNDNGGWNLKRSFLYFLNYLSPKIMDRVKICDFMVPSVVLVLKSNNNALKKFHSRQEFETEMANEAFRNYILKECVIHDEFDSFGSHCKDFVKNYISNHKSHIVEIELSSSDAPLLDSCKIQSQLKTAIFPDVERSSTNSDYSLSSSGNVPGKVALQDLLRRIVQFRDERDIANIPSILTGFKEPQNFIVITALFCGVFNENVETLKKSAFAAEIKKYTTYTSRFVELEFNIDNMCKGQVPLLSMPTGGAGLDKSGHYSTIEPSAYAHLLFTKEDFSFATKERTHLSSKMRKTDLMCTIPYFLLYPHTIMCVEGTMCKPNWIYKLENIIENLELMDEGKEPVRMMPYFPKNPGSIHTQGDNLISVGKLKYVHEKKFSLEILALPITTTPYYYTKTLMALKKASVIDSFSQLKTPKPKLTVTFSKANYIKHKRNPQNFYTTLKLVEILEETKLTALNGNYQRQEYRNSLEMLKEYYELRIEFYQRRPHIKTRTEAIETWKLDREELLKALPQSSPIRDTPEENIVPFTPI
ncbi:hypothetical protein DMENIID0001_026230 [Sergentomyia squamirostris]